MKKNPVKDKSYIFALKMIKLYQYLAKEQKEYVLSKQLLKSATSIGANIEEAIGGQSRKDFFAKISIAYKECRETNYWLRLLRDSKIIPTEKAVQFIGDSNELIRLIGSIKKTIQNNQEILNS